MRKATDKEINDFIKYRANHVALVQRIGKVVFDKDFSDHDFDKIAADGETLNLYALRNSMINGNYHPKGEDKKALDALAGKHVKSQKHHPEYWDPAISAETFDDSNPPQCFPSRMPDRYLMEMCCDWAAVALKRNQPLFKWINKNCFDDTRFVFTPRQQDLIVEYTNKIIDSIDKEHLAYPGVTYTAKQVEPKLSKMTEDDCGGVCGGGMSSGFQAQAPEHLAKIGDGTGLIDPSGKLPLKETEELKAPNGRKSNLNKKQWNQVRTEAFKKWFGDWENDPANASKVVDENGEPLVVYHGTDEKFDEFNPYLTKNGKELGFGSYFTRDKKQAEAYGEVGGYFLNLRNPFFTDKIDFDTESFDDVDDAMDFFSKQQKRWNDEAEGYERFFPQADVNDDKYIVKYSKSFRHDADDTNDGKISGNVYVAYDANQVKSATDNNGNFSTTSDNVKESLYKGYNILRESILDVPMKETYEGVLKDGKMTPECRGQIIETIKLWKKQINFDFNIYKIWAKGSLLTKRYNDTTDLDVGIYTDMNDSQLNLVIPILPKGQNIIVNGKESSHPLDFYVQVKEDSIDLSNFDAVYDVANDKWVKEPKDYENEIPLDYLMEVSNFFINGCSIAIRNYENDKVLYQYYDSLDPSTQEITEDEKAQHLSAKKSDLMADLDALRVALRMISSFRTEAYTEGGMDLQINITSDNPHVTIQEQLAKILEKFGIRQKLRDYVAECSKILGVKQEVRESKEIKDFLARF